MYYPASLKVCNATKPQERNVGNAQFLFACITRGIKILQWSSALRKKTKTISLSWNTWLYLSPQPHFIPCFPSPQLSCYTGLLASPPYMPCSYSHKAFACAFAPLGMLFSALFAYLIITYSKITAKLSSLTRSIHESLLYNPHHISNFAFIYDYLIISLFPTRL